MIFYIVVEKINKGAAMEKIITINNLKNFTYSNHHLITGTIKGIVVDFFGLGAGYMINEDSFTSKYYAEQNILFLVPYNNPWAWMNKQAIDYTDEIMDVIFEHFQLDEKTPIVSSGGSMGGQSALVYTRYAKRQPVACVTNCPVCDMVYHYTERVDLPRTLYSAFFNENCSLNEALESYSPLHLAPTMPRIKYFIFHCSADTAVNIDKHSRRLVNAMQAQNFDISFTVVPDKGHCDLGDDIYQKYIGICANAIAENLKLA